MIHPVEEQVRLQIFIAQVLPDVAVETIRGGLNSSVDDGASRVAKLGIEVAALQLELLNGVWRRSDGCVTPDRRPTVHLNVVVDAIQSEVVLPDVDSIHRKVGATGCAGVSARL